MRVIMERWNSVGDQYKRRSRQGRSPPTIPGIQVSKMAFCKALLVAVALCASIVLSKPVSYDGNGDVTAYNTTLKNPQRTNWGDWGEWELCPPGKFVYGMQLKTHRYVGAFEDDTGLNGIKFFCDDIGSDDDREAIITSKIGEHGSFQTEFFCPNPAKGFQMLSEKDLGWFNDDTAASNLRLFCGSKVVDGDGVNWGDWTAPQYCDPKQAICGLRTQVEKPNSDSTALNNIEVLCCPVQEPADNCVPSDEWDMILECDNLGAVSDTKCSYERKVGVSTYNMQSQSQVYMHELYWDLGFSIGSAIGPLGAAFQTQLGESEFTSYNWTSSSTEVWTEEEKITIDMDIPPGVITQLWQPKGTCSFYNVRANKLKRVDSTSRTMSQPSISYIDF